MSEETMDVTAEIENPGKTIAAAIDRFSEKVCEQLAESTLLQKKHVELYERDLAERNDPKILAERMRQGVEFAINGMQQPEPPLEVVGARLPRHGQKTAVRVEMPKQPTPGQGA